MGSALNVFHRIHYDLPDGNELRPAPPLHQVEHPLLRILKNGVQTFLADIAVVCNLFIQTDQPAEHRFVRDNARIVLYVRRGGHRRNQISDKFRAADLRRHIFLPQSVLQSHQIHRFSLIVQFHHRIEQNTVLFVVKVLPYHNLRGCNDGLTIHDHGTDDRLLRLHAVGQYSFQ